MPRANRPVVYIDHIPIAKPGLFQTWWTFGKVALGVVLVYVLVICALSW